jgi:hypothetical protein
MTRWMGCPHPRFGLPKPSEVLLWNCLLDGGACAWGEVFGDRVIASAILDRLLHHPSTINIKGESYRLREKLKAGLVKSKLAVEPGSDGTSRS